VLKTTASNHALNHARWISVLSLGTLLVAAPLRAQDAPLPPVTVGAGLQTSYAHDSPTGGSSTDQFLLNSIRLYVNGSAAKNIKFMFNTEYDGGTNKVGILDAAAQFGISNQANFWVGRFLPPSDRANLYGPYYANEWAVYTDGVQDGYPFLATGRDNGALYWGQFGMLKASAGVFDGKTTTGDKKVLVAARGQLDFWDPEGGYYLNGTYYGDKNLLAVGGAVQAQDGNTAYNGDFLLEKKIAGGSVFTVEAELAKYDKLGGYDGQYGTDTGGYGLASFLFPPMMGMTGRFELMGKFAKAKFSKGFTIANVDYDQTTSEINADYVIRQFNARIMLFYVQQNFSAVKANDKKAGVGFQIQM
jgi:hypothetical protein